MAKYGIIVLVCHNEPLPKYPERTRDHGIEEVSFSIKVFILSLANTI